ncbi:hypothetical protein FQA39_LY10411 [Lamprigera yunnana]|nr:hypothetical protein FQA39_LY10411 [Lamprigera yunnana]
MDETNMNTTICEIKIDKKKGANSDSLENITKLKGKTKNGLVNGVREEKLKCSNKKSKETKRNKKGNLDLQNNCIDIKSSSDEQSTQIGTNNLAENNTKHSKEHNVELSSKKINQSKSKSVVNHESKKNKSKTDKSEENELPKFDLASLISPLIVSDAATPSTSKITTPFNQPILDGQDGSDFERDLIESIKNMKIRQEKLNENIETVNQEVITEEESDQKEILPKISYVQYESELQMPMIMKIIQKDLSEPYSIYTYRYFIHNWPKLCFLAMCEEKCVGAIVCKLDFHRKAIKRGYIAMLAVDKDYRKRSIGSTLVRRAILEMIEGGADEVVLETEVTNKPALRLYEQLGFVRDKRLFRYYLNGVDALRLKLWLR